MAILKNFDLRETDEEYMYVKIIYLLIVKIVREPREYDIST